MRWKASLRFLVRHRALSVIAILTIALAVGANTVIFGVVRAVFLRPLGFPAEDRLVEIRECSEAMYQRDLKRGYSSHDGRGCISVSGALYADFEKQARSYERVGAGNYTTELVALTGSAEPLLVVADRVTPSLFQVLGVPPRMGRWLEGDGEIVLGYDLWQTRFGADPDLLGRTIQVAGAAHTVVGVMPNGFAWPEKAQIWLPHPYGTPRYSEGYLGHNLQVIGRLRPGVRIEAARAEAAAFSARAAKIEPRMMEWTSRVDTLISDLTFSYRRSFTILSVAVVIVLLIACANLSNLLLASLEGRSTELAIRVSVGAGRKDLFLQILAESLALALAGGLLGLIFVLWGLDLIRPIIPAAIPRVDEIRADLPVALFSIAVSVFTGAVFAIVPGLRASEWHLGAQLRSGMGRTVTGAGLRGGLVAVQVALAVVLLAGAGLLMNTLRHLSQQETGFRRGQLMTAQVPLQMAGDRRGERALTFANELVRRLGEKPGIAAAGLGFPLPFTGDQQGTMGLELEGRGVLDLSVVQVRSYYPGTFEAMGTPLIQGRFFRASDQPPANICIVNRTFARRALGAETIVGRRLRTSPRNGWMEIVGVVGDVRQLTLDKDPGPEIYYPWHQRTFSRFTVAVRYDGGSDRAAVAIREAVRAVDPNQPVGEIATMDDLVWRSNAPRRFPLVLFSVFGALALGIAAVGVFGVVSQSVSGRIRELGVRLALGATPATVLWMVLRQALAPVAVGLAAGIGLAMLATRYIESLLFGVRPGDPWTLAGVCVVLTVVATAASLGPSLRACRTDPVEALRCN